MGTIGLSALAAKADYVLIPISPMRVSRSWVV
nr:hypothetical protein [Paraglaciecola polaris]